MAMFLFDTNIISYSAKGHQFSDFYANEINSEHDLFISAQTLGELLFGAKSKQWGEARTQMLIDSFSPFTVFPIDYETANFWADIRICARKNGRNLSVQDTWVVAGALQFDLTLVTHDKEMATIAACMNHRVICRAGENDR